VQQPVQAWPPHVLINGSLTSSELCLEYGIRLDAAAVSPQVLITWECTIAHAIPWDTFFPWIQKDTDRARFVSAISKASIEHEHKLQRTGWIACDPLAVAVAIRPELIEEAEVCCCTTE
jgi:inosine-uridine nucleoside N-ribohydrolase